MPTLYFQVPGPSNPLAKGLPPGAGMAASKPGFLQRIGWKGARRQVAYLKTSKDYTKAKRTLGWVSLITGALGALFLFTGGAMASLVLSPIALITGIISLSLRGDSKNTRAAIGTVLGGVVTIILLVVIASFSLH